MDIDEHQLATDLTAQYPGVGTASELALAYIALGLVGEASELLEKVVAGDGPGTAAEAGDVLWYVSRFHRECGITSAETFGRSSHTAPTGDPATALVIAAGRLAEVVKKMIRDDGGTLSAARRAAVVDSLAQVAGAWRALHGTAGLDPAETARANIAKLLDRKRRDVISGSGDDR